MLNKYIMKLLIIDDDKSGLNSLCSALKPLDYDVNYLNDPLFAMKHFSDITYDVVITDLRMPLLNGLEVLKIVKRRSPRTKVIVYTGDVDVTLEDEAKKYNVDLFMRKPIKIGEMINFLKAYENGAAESK